MNSFDSIILSILILGLARGFFRGILSEISSIFAIIFGFHIGCKYYNLIARELFLYPEKQPYINFFSFLVLFLAITILTANLTVFAKYLFNLTRINLINRIFGGFIGILKAGFFILTIIIMIISFFPGKNKLIKESILSPYIIKISKKTISPFFYYTKKNFD